MSDERRSADHRGQADDAYEQTAWEALKQVTDGSGLDVDQAMAVAQTQAMLAISHRLGYLCELLDPRGVKLRLFGP